MSFTARTRKEYFTKLVSPVTMNLVVPASLPGMLVHRPQSPVLFFWYWYPVMLESPGLVQPRVTDSSPVPWMANPPGLAGRTPGVALVLADQSPQSTLFLARTCTW